MLSFIYMREQIQSPVDLLRQIDFLQSSDTFTTLAINCPAKIFVSINQFEDNYINIFFSFNYPNFDDVTINTRGKFLFSDNCFLKRFQM